MTDKTDTNADTDILPPTTLLLTNQNIYETTSSPPHLQHPQELQHKNKPLYQINQPITTTSPSKPFTSTKFERVEHNTTTNKHLFYLAHPAHARYRTDTPAYYLTSAERGMIGNIHFETPTSQGKQQKKMKKTKRRPGFTAVLSPGRSASDRPLFSSDGDGEECRVLFTATQTLSRWSLKGMGRKRGYTWTNSSGEQVAFEENLGEGEGEGECERKLVITASMRRDLRDVLVALWMLRVWFETAESKRARREGNQPSPVGYMQTAN